MSEDRFRHDVLALATEMGLLTHYCGDARKCGGRRGFPDLVVVGKYGVLFAELKTDAGDTSLEQDLWLWTLNSASGRSSLVSVALWRPGDLSSGVIEATLRGLCEKPAQNTLKNGRRNHLPGLERART